MTHRLLVSALIAAFASGGVSFPQGTDADLATGVRQAQEGDFDAAVITLDRVTRRLAGQKGREKDLARAYLYLSVAQFGLNRERDARASFLQALQADRSLQISTKEFPPKIVKFFESVKAEAAATAAAPAKPPQPSSAPAPAPATPPAQRPTQPSPSAAPAEKKGSGGKVALIVLGGAAVVGGGIALAGGGGGGSEATVQPAHYIVAGSSGPNSELRAEDRLRVVVNGQTVADLTYCGGNSVPTCTGLSGSASCPTSGSQFHPPVQFTARPGDRLALDATYLSGGYQLSSLMLYKDGAPVMNLSGGIARCSTGLSCSKPCNNQFQAFFSQTFTLP